MRLSMGSGFGCPPRWRAPTGARRAPVNGPVDLGVLVLAHHPKARKQVRSAWLALRTYVRCTGDVRATSRGPLPAGDRLRRARRRILLRCYAVSTPWSGNISPIPFRRNGADAQRTDVVRILAQVPKNGPWRRRWEIGKAGSSSERRANAGSTSSPWVLLYPNWRPHRRRRSGNASTM